MLKSEKWRNVWLRQAGTLGGRARDGAYSGFTDQVIREDPSAARGVADKWVYLLIGSARFSCAKNAHVTFTAPRGSRWWPSPKGKAVCLRGAWRIVGKKSE